MALNILMIGHGAIGSWVCRYLLEISNIRLGGVVVRPGKEQTLREQLGGDIQVVSDTKQLEEKPDYAVECAGHEGLSAHGTSILRQGIPLGIVSVGALSDDQLFTSLKQTAIEGATHLDIIPGAIGAIDALSAAHEGQLYSVKYQCRKPPESWINTPAEKMCDLQLITEAVTHYQGNARDAAKQYPKNANVAATIALAGIGMEETSVTLIADPRVTKNIHEIEVEGEFGQFSFQIAGNSLPDNPKSSALTAMSVLNALKNKNGLVRI